MDIKDTQQIGYNENFEKNWAFSQKVFWLIMFIFIFAGALGAFGKGYLAQAKIENKHYTIEYERFAHYQAPTQLSITFQSSSTEKSVSIAIHLDKEILDHLSIQKISPKPTKEYLDSEGKIFVFDSLSISNSKVIFQFEGSKTGNFDGKIRYDAMPAEILNITIFP